MKCPLPGARTSMPPTKRCPLGLFFIPLSRCHKPPPTAPMPKAPPTSSRILQQVGGRVCMVYMLNSTATLIAVLESAAGIEFFAALFCCSAGGLQLRRRRGGTPRWQPPLPKRTVGWSKNAGARRLAARGPQAAGMARRRAAAKGWGRALSAARHQPPCNMPHATAPGAHLSGQGSCRGTGATLLSLWAPRGGVGWPPSRSTPASALTLP